MRNVYICNNTIKGVFSAFHDAWKESRDMEVEIQFRENNDYQFFCNYIEVEECDKKAQIFEHLVCKNLGYESYYRIYHALLCNDPKKGTAVFRMVQDARKINNSKMIMEHLGNENVMKVFELSRKVLGEAHLTRGFIRFRELEGGVLFAEITPKSQILTCLIEYFSNRYPMENWVIYDKTHKMSLVHQVGKPCFIMALDEVNQREVEKISSMEDDYQELWREFVTSIAIKERKNYKLQRSLLPLRYRENMTEFKKS